MLAESQPLESQQSLHKKQSQLYEETIKSHTSTIAALRILHSEHDIGIETVAAETLRLRPIAKAGFWIRGRPIEKDKGRQYRDQEVISRGDVAAHGGNVIADAGLYQPWLANFLGLECRTDPKRFEYLYGVDLSLAARIPKDSKYFADVLNMFFWMRTMHDYIKKHPPAAEKSAIFFELVNKVFARGSHWTGEQYGEFLGKKGEGHTIYQEIADDVFDPIYQAQDAWIKNR